MDVLKKMLLIFPVVHHLRILYHNLGLLLKNRTLRIGYNVSITDCVFDDNVTLGHDSELIRLKIGRHSYLAHDCFFRDVVVGNYCSIGPGVKVGLGYHPLDFVSKHPIFYSNEGITSSILTNEMKYQDHKSTSIGNDVWIGANVIIADGVNIGNGAVIASGAVVTKDVLPYELVGGVPAKHIYFLFDKKEIETLENGEWWNWNEERIVANFELFRQPKEFLNKLDNGAG